MKILHMCLSNFYIDKYNYQENILPRINSQHGHDVQIIASCETFINNKYIGFVEPQKYTTETGIPIERVPFLSPIPKIVCKKLGLYKNINIKIKEINPDVILYHGSAGRALLELKKYKIKNPNVKIYIDSHADFNNSGRNFLSRNILHKTYNRFLLQKTLPYIEKVLYITAEVKEFLIECGKVPKDKMEFFPLGGTFLEKSTYLENRNKKRNELKLDEANILMLHSGKLDKLKRTEELLGAFSEVENPKVRLGIIGSIPDEMNSILMPLIERDNRVIYLGWKTGKELQEYLCAGDIYLQPGGQSVTMQNAICLHNALMLYPHKSHLELLKCNVEYVKDKNDMISFFEKIREDESVIALMKESGIEFAKEYLDYNKLAKRIYE